MLQRTKQWFEARSGKFTSSEIHKLMGVKGLGKTGETYCFDKACETLFGIEEDDSLDFLPDIKRGRELEPMAFRKFEDIISDRFLECSEGGFFTWGQNSASSPDGLVGQDGILEIKCPRSPKLFRLIDQGEDGIDKQYVFQMQHQMLCSGRNKSFFFNYGIHNNKEIYHLIEIERDEVIINLMKERINEAIKIKEDFEDSILKSLQFD